MNPNFPVYIVSKGRWESRLTSKELDRLGVPYHVIVEAAEYDAYASTIGPARALVLPQRYLDEYDTCDELGNTKSKGPGAARNFAWDHAIERGAAWHWVMDDNISRFSRMNRNLAVYVTSGTIFRVAEDFIMRYSSVAQAGFQYDFFARAKRPEPPYRLNTRIYSCLLIRNDIPYRWRARYNEDTDLSLRVLKDGWATVLFYAFQQSKAQTQTMRGGNTADFYAVEGTAAKSEMLARLHPDVARVVPRFGRVHHHVNYRPFQHNPLRRKPGLVIPHGVNNYGMALESV